RVVGIPGLPPPTTEPAACAFAPRCSLADEHCRSAHPELEGPSRHAVRCFRWRAAAGDSPGESLAEGPAAAGERVIAVEGLEFSYPEAPRPALTGIEFSVRAGETLGIVGESGSGKTTLLRLIAGITSPTAGRIVFRRTEL